MVTTLVSTRPELFKKKKRKTANKNEKPKQPPAISSMENFQ